MPATDLAEADLADLAQLQKLRQECLKLREYNEALNKIIVIKRLEQEKTCLQRARSNRRDALHRRVLLGEAALTIRCLRGMLLAWRRRTQRCRSMLWAFKRESDVFLRARWFRKWRVVLLEKKVLLSTDFCREKKLLAEGMQQKLREAQEGLEKARSQRSAQRLDILALAHGPLSGTSWQIFTRWADYVSSAHSHRRQVKLLLFAKKSCLLQDIFNSWHATLRCNRRKPKLTFSIVDSRSEQVARRTTSRLSMFFDAWRHVAAFNEKTQAAATFQNVFPTRTASFCIQHQRRVQLAESLWTWRNFASREAQEEEHASICHTCESQEAMASRRQLADLRGTSICQDAWKWNLLRTSLSSWIWSSISSRLRERCESLQEVQRLSLTLAAAEGQERSVKMALGALACASSLRRLLCRRQHIAFKHWRSRQASHGIFVELEAAKSSAALLSLNRQCLEDLFVEQHHTVLRAQQAAQEVAAAWVLYSKQSLFRRTMVAWRVGSLAFRSERKRQWQDMQRKAEDANFSLLDKEEAIQAKTAEVLFCSSAQQFLSLIVKQWRRLAFKEKRSREVELLRQRSQVRLQEQQRRLEQAQLATVRYRNHAFASCFATSAVGSTNWLRLFLWDWRRAVTSSTSIKILRLWYIVAAMEIFKCKHWLLEFCLRLWSAILHLPRSDILSHSESADAKKTRFCERIIGPIFWPLMKLRGAPLDKASPRRVTGRYSCPAR